MLSESGTHVAVSCGPAEYRAGPWYAPVEAPPEYPFQAGGRASGTGDVYMTVRESLRWLGFDGPRFGTRDWSPLSAIIKPGDTVVLKPNFVRDFRETQMGHGDCTITHGAVIRAMADYVYLALQGRGRMVICDAPQNDADFQAIRRIAGLDEICGFYRKQAGFEVEVYDLRSERAVKAEGVIIGHEPLPGDPAGYVRVDLAGRSAFAPINDLCHLLYGSEYETDEVRRHHRGGVQEYLVSRTILDADCVIGLPKLKTHKKVGLTASLKNTVGISGNKNWLPHHRDGPPCRGGDQFADDGWLNRLERSTMARFRRLFPMLGRLRPAVARPIKALGRRFFGDTNVDRVRSGNWYGNDTTWRMVLDLNRILIYADADGELQDRPVRRFLSVVDAIVAGEGNGPLDATPRKTGLVLAGLDPVAVDLACARLMGFDYQKLPVLRNALQPHPHSLAGFEYGEVVCSSNEERFDQRLCDVERLCPAFKPHFGWAGHVEMVEPRHEMAPVA